MDTITLIGAEDVRAAGRNVQGAAQEMKAAASYIEDSLERHRRFLDDWLQRLEIVLVAGKKGGGKG